MQLVSPWKDFVNGFVEKRSCSQPTGNRGWGNVKLYSQFREMPTGCDRGGIWLDRFSDRDRDDRFIGQRCGFDHRVVEYDIGKSRQQYKMNFC